MFGAAAKAYASVGLVQHQRKQKRNQSSGIILGADFDGRAGRVMAPRSRIAILCWISMIVCHKGTCTARLLSSIIGCWVHVLLFRRVLFAVMNDLFKQGQGLPLDQVFCLSRQARCELQLLAALAPTAQTDPRTSYASKIYCTDASPLGGAVCAAPISPLVTQELWRHAEQRGTYTKLQSPASAVLSELGIPSSSDDSFSPAPNFVDPPVMSVPSSLSEGILFDCVELFRGAGNWTSVHADRGLRCHDGFDNDGRRLRCSDLASDGVFRELIALAARRVVREWHSGVPCLSYGTLRRPQVRSKEQPYGFDPSDPFTAYHNMLARRCAMIFTLALLLGQFISVEQPRSSRMFLLHCFQVLVRLGCVVSHFCFCSFGSAFQKASKWLHNKPWLLPLEGTCTCGRDHKHFVVQGTFTKTSIAEFDSLCKPNATAVYGRLPYPGERVSSYSASYPLQLVNRMASGSLAQKNGQSQRIPISKQLSSLAEVGLETETPSILPSTEPVFPPKPWYEDPEWIKELIDSLPFKESFRFIFKRSGHINVNETRTYKTWIKSMAKSSEDSRFLGLLDSRVTIGAAAKGRSSSYSISRVLQGSVAYVIGGGLYPGLLHCYSGDNRADEPSRDRPVRAPSRLKPFWMTALESGDTRPFDCAVGASQFSKNPARWLRLLLMLSGDIEPNPGPACRGKLDMSVGFAQATVQRMSRCLEAFRTWCCSQDFSWEQLIADPHAIALALRAYGLYCFEHGIPRYVFVYSITAVQDAIPAARAYLAPAWQVDKKWQVHEPGSCRSVLPAVAIRAIACLGVLWGWLNWVGIFLLGFAAMLHPAEMVSLRREDLIFPKDVFYDSPSLFVKIRNPKTARFARRQHGRIDDPQVIAFAEKVFDHLPKTALLFPGSMATFRKQWNCLMDRLGIPNKQSEQGATPGVLRGSGATYLYSFSEDINWVAWRGRWCRTRTLEFYLQEVAAQVMVHSLHPVAKARIETLSKFSGSVIHALVLTG